MNFENKLPKPISKSIALIVFFLLTASQAFSQFTLLTDDIRGLRQGDATWTDFDADGDLDLMTFGDDTLAIIYTEFYENQDLSFKPFDVPSFPDVNDGALDWADYDNDGNMDMALMGFSLEDGILIKVLEYENDFSDTELVFPNVYRGSVDWGDYNNDGQDDLLIVGQASNSNSSTRLFRQEGGDFVEVELPGVTGVSFGCAEWADYDGDGMLDFIISGVTGTASDIGSPVTELYRNTGDGFVQVFEGTFEGLEVGSIDWGDADNDGDLDLLITGLTKEKEGLPEDLQFTGVYINNITSFELVETSLPAVIEGIAKWGDIDNDGDLDILISGDNVVEGRLSKVFANDALVFTEVFSTTGLGQTAGGWGDFNNDGFLDFFLNGQMSNLGLLGVVYLNDGAVPGRIAKVNSAPSVPTNVTAMQSGSGIRIEWEPSVDDITEGSTLSYSVQIEKEGKIIVPALSNSNGSRMVVEIGNAGLNNFFSARITEMGTYTYKVQAIDNSFNASSFATGTIVIEDLLTSVDDLKNKTEVFVYPNPAVNGKLNLKNVPYGTSYGIYSVSGLLLTSGVVSQPIDVSALSAGTYLIVLEESKSMTKFHISR
ncbi:MAG: FG-GAP-like repeat-containing protein [Cyclobacteriaceae bacterium]